MPRLPAGTPRMADADINIEVLYSDHYNQLVPVVDDMTRGREISAAWMREVAVAEQN